MNMNDHPTCELCGADLCGKDSIDLTATVTSYATNGEILGTLDNVEWSVQETPDYVVIGKDCCGEIVRVFMPDIFEKLADIKRTL